MLEIIVDEIDSYVANPRENVAALAAIREKLRARPEGYQFMPKFRAKIWDGYISLMSGFGKFPTGLLDLACYALEQRHIKHIISVRYKKLPHKVVMPDDLIGVTLRDYQIDAANALLENVRGVAKMATNSGKTEVMAAIIKSLGIPRTVVVLHRKELLYQTVERFKKRLNIDVGIIGDGEWDPKRVTVAMVQTLSSSMGDYDFSKNVVLIIDECHNASSDQMMNVVGNIPGAYRYGFSGTPLKYDVLRDMKLISVTGEIIVDISNDYLIAKGYSAKPIIHMHELSSKKYWDTDYVDAYSEVIIHNKKRNAIIRKLALRNDDGTMLILVSRIEHGELLNDSIPDSVFISGSHTTERRKAAINAMHNGGVFIATPIFDEGIDIPNISTLVLAGGGDSDVKLLQRIGRGLRKKDGDNTLHVHDFYDNTNKFTHNQSKSRLGVYNDEGFEVQILGR